MAKITGKKYPSRIKYEQANPTVSCRVPKEIFERLKAINEADDKSFADILKIGLGMLEPVFDKAKDREEELYSDGFDAGYSEAENQYKTTYRCSVCGKILKIRAAAEKLAAGQYMTEKGWGHGECHKKYR
ncbi:hypothetical protein ACFLVX_04880 [Chloroflexota bacterium]